MPIKINSITITDGIQVTVEPEFVQEENTKEGNKHLFSYRVEIANVGKEWAKLVSRYWCIINADGEKDEVRGGGVVGYYPELKPGATFTYTSYCPLDTDWGTMEGFFEMLKEDGTSFNAKIDRFYLINNKLIEDNR
jgi:ApaG protein